MRSYTSDVVAFGWLAGLFIVVGRQLVELDEI